VEHPPPHATITFQWLWPARRSSCMEATTEGNGWAIYIFLTQGTSGAQAEGQPFRVEIPQCGCIGCASAASTDSNSDGHHSGLCGCGRQYTGRRRRAMLELWRGVSERHRNTHTATYPQTIATHSSNSIYGVGLRKETASGANVTVVGDACHRRAQGEVRTYTNQPPR
jgi:hypothetical protein